jgi:hypothetical protein
MTAWTWLIHSAPGQLFRIAAGVAIFAVLALDDLRRHGQAATRWREYTFLFLCVFFAMIYGVMNDQITSGLSWEYFYYGKDLASELGPQIPPDPLKLHLAAALIGIKATWSAGLLIGVVLLLANNPARGLPRLRNRSLLTHLPLILLLTALFAAAGAVAGHFALPACWNDDFAQMLRHNEMRPRRFMTAYGIHLGGYVGGAIATLLAAGRLRSQRRRKIELSLFEA